MWAPLAGSRLQLAWAGAVLLALLAPFAITIPYEQSLLVTIAIYSIAAVGLSIVMGQMGQFSFGHAAFYGIGAYVSGQFALTTGLTPWVGLPLATLVTGLVGIIVGAIALRRTRGMELGIITLGFGAILWIVMLKWTAVGGGLSGVSGVPALSVGDFQFLTPRSYYYVALSLLVAVVFVTVRLTRSSGGRAVIAIRENEDLAMSVGVAPTPHLVLTFGLGGAWAGLAGALTAHDVRFLSPSFLSLSTMLGFLMMVLIGGTGRVWGPVLGTALFVWIGELVRIREDLRNLLFGVVVLAVVRFIPDGAVALLSNLSRLLRRLLASWTGGKRVDMTESHQSGAVGATVPMVAVPIKALGDWDGESQAPPEGIALRTRDLEKRFGGLIAVSGLDLDVAEGEVYGLIGPNGSGKTTALNVISGYLPASGGQVEYRGRRIDGLRPFQTARMGLVRTFQITSLFPALTVVENVVYGSHLQTRPHVVSSVVHGRAFRAQERRVWEWARGILDFVGLATQSDETARNLSGGEQRYLGLAIALAANPSVLLLDEPAAGLNPAEANRLSGLILALRDSGMTVLVVEHNMKLIADICSRVSVLNFGKVIAAGSPREVAVDEQVVEAYLGRRWRHTPG